MEKIYSDPNFRVAHVKAQVGQARLAVGWGWGWGLSKDPPATEINMRRAGTVACTGTLTCAGRAAGESAVQPRKEDYRAKAKEYARLTVVTKSLREGRRYRKFAEMYWALALAQDSEPERVHPPEISVKASPR
jgi:hypothetical protein